MKKTLFTLLLTITSVVVFAQTKTYKPNPVLDKFVGAWMAKTGNGAVTIIIKKIQVPGIHTKTDQLQGYLTYKNESQVIEDSTTPNLTNGTNASNGDEVYQDKISFNFFDSKKGKTSVMKVELSKSNPNEFTTLLIERSDLNLFAPAARKKLEGFTIPMSLKFKRQK